MAGIQLILPPMIAMCSSPTLDNAKKVIEANNLMTSTTCRVSAWDFELTFKLNPSTGKWESVNGPMGPCGTIKHVSLEKEKFQGISFWNFRQKAVVTNPTGNIAGASCASLADEEMFYQWRSRVVRPMCEFVKFGAF